MPKTSYRIELFRSAWSRYVLKKFRWICLNLFYDIKLFWIKVACYNFLWEFANARLLSKKLNQKIKETSLKININFLINDFWDFIELYKKREFKIWQNCKKIRVLWRQWIDKAPEIVKICIDSIRRNSSWYEVVFLDKNNLEVYVQLPKFIIDKVDNKEISLTHLSDIIRMYLLKEYWWIWCDATMFINCKVFKSFDNTIFNSCIPNPNIKTPWEYGSWCSFFIWWKSNKLFAFTYDFMIEYYKRYKKFINYFLVDYCIYLYVTQFEDWIKLISNISNKNDIFLLANSFNNTYSADYDKIIKDNFYKLTYKLNFQEYNQWKLTNYWKFIQDFSS